MRELETDDVVDLIEDLEDAAAGGDPGRARSAPTGSPSSSALTYPEFSAGRLMQREMVAAPEHWTVGEAIDFLRVDATICPSSSTT